MSCKAIMVPQMIVKSHGYGWLFPKHSPLFPLFDLYIKKTIEDGSFQRVKSYYPFRQNKKPNCLKHEGEPIGSEKTVLLFVLMSAGAAISMLSLR